MIRIATKTEDSSVLDKKLAVTDQAAMLREMVNVQQQHNKKDCSQTSPRILAVTSGKGGVGKTNLAVNLGICMKARGAAVTLVDLDMGLANADVLLDVQPRYCLGDVLSGRRDILDISSTTANGVHFVAGASGVEGLNNLSNNDRDFLLEQLPVLGGDVILLDCAAGIAPGVISFACLADVVLVVTTPEPTAMTDAYATIKTLVREGYTGKVKLVVNMVESRPEAKEVFRRIHDVCEKFLKYTIADAGYMLHDTHVELSVRQRTPFVVQYPRSSASACTSAIAARLVSGDKSRRGPLGIVGRVAGMFV